MKNNHSKLFLVPLLFVFATIPTFVFAFGVQPFGGKITTVHTPATVTCTTNIQSPFMIVPVTGLPGPWSAMFGIVNVGQITPGAWILGLTIPGSGGCVTDSAPPLLFPTTTTNFYGTSSFGF